MIGGQRGEGKTKERELSMHASLHREDNAYIATQDDMNSMGPVMSEK